MAKELITTRLPSKRELVTYRRDSAFSYTCHACCRCCHDKIIQLNPYEVARLAENRGLSTTEFLVRYTEQNGTALRRVEQGACVFLTPQGCGVHPDRPLVCRLYPLGRRVTAEGEESFHEVTPHPQTEGEYGTSGTVEQFLNRQGALPFIEAVDRYVELVGRMSAVLSATVGHDVQLQQEVQEVVEELEQGQQQGVSDWIDMDRVVAHRCAQRNQPIPSGVLQKMGIHIQVIEEWLRTTSSLTKEEHNDAEQQK
jgi:Fe-S-cluster containining protein